MKNIIDFMSNAKIIKVTADIDPQRCDDFIYHHGSVQVVLCQSSDEANVTVAKMTEESGWKHDYHMSAGRAIIKQSPVPIGNFVIYSESDWFDLGTAYPGDEFEKAFERLTLGLRKLMSETNDKK